MRPRVNPCAALSVTFFFWTLGVIVFAWPGSWGCKEVQVLYRLGTPGSRKELNLEGKQEKEKMWPPALEDRLTEKKAASVGCGSGWSLPASKVQLVPTR